MGLVYLDQHKHTLSLHNYHTKGSNTNFSSTLSYLIWLDSLSMSVHFPAAIDKSKLREKAR